MSGVGRFDLRPDINYGKCEDCDAVLATEEQTHAHLSETLEQSKGNRGHMVRILNASREDRIERALTEIIDEHLQRAYEEIDDLIERGHVTKDEVAQAYALSYDIETGWEEYIEESQG